MLKSSFVDKALKGDQALIDTTDIGLAGSSVRSLLSKFAILIKPLSYTMYDTRGVKSLRSFDGPSSYKSYDEYYKVFIGYQQKLEPYIESTDLKYYIKLCKKQGKTCPEDIFRNRLGDKYLWVKQELA